MREVQRLIGRITIFNWFVSKATDKCLSFFKILKKVFKFEWTPKCEDAFIWLKEYLSQSPLFSKPQLKEDLYLYLAISNVVVSTVLIWEKKGMQLLIYYMSHSMLSAETRYLSFKKLALALLVALRKLKSYFQAHPIVIFTSNSLRQVLHCLEASRRLMQWLIKLN